MTDLKQLGQTLEWLLEQESLKGSLKIDEHKGLKSLVQLEQLQ